MGWPTDLACMCQAEQVRSRRRTLTAVSVRKGGKIRSFNRAKGDQFDGSAG